MTVLAIKPNGIIVDGELCSLSDMQHQLVVTAAMEDGQEYSSVLVGDPLGVHISATRFRNDDGRIRYEVHVESQPGGVSSGGIGTGKSIYTAFKQAAMYSSSDHSAHDVRGDIELRSNGVVVNGTLKEVQTQLIAHTDGSSWSKMTLGEPTGPHVSFIRARDNQQRIVYEVETHLVGEDCGWAQSTHLSCAYKDAAH